MKSSYAELRRFRIDQELASAIAKAYRRLARRATPTEAEFVIPASQRKKLYTLL